MSKKLDRKNLNLHYFFRDSWMTSDEIDEFSPLFDTVKREATSKNYDAIDQLMANGSDRFRNLSMMYMISNSSDETFGFFLDIFINYADIHYDNDLFFLCAVASNVYGIATMLIEKASMCVQTTIMLFAMLGSVILF